MPRAISRSAISASSPTRRSSTPSAFRSRSAPHRRSRAPIIGFFLAYAVVLGGLPRWLRPTLLTFSGVASNFAGVPLAFAFIATLGRTGLVTALLIKFFDFNIYSTGFNLLSFWGLTLTYLYFQIPLMVLILTPALDGLKPQWREASDILGASHGSIGARRAADPVAEPPWHDAAAFRQRLRRRRHRLCADRLVAEHRHHPALRPDPRRRAPRPEPRLRAGARHDPDHRRVERRLHLAARPIRAVAAMKRVERLVLDRVCHRRALLRRAADCDLRILPAPEAQACIPSTPIASSSATRVSRRRSAIRRWSPLPRSCSVFSSSCRPPIGSSSACRGCARWSNSSRCCRWWFRRS